MRVCDVVVSIAMLAPKLLPRKHFFRVQAAPKVDTVAVDRTDVVHHENESWSEIAECDCEVVPDAGGSSDHEGSAIS